MVEVDIQTMEKYSRGWRGAPAKGVGRLRGARVQIPLSPLIETDTEFNLFITLYEYGRQNILKKFKKDVDKEKKMW